MSLLARLRLCGIAVLLVMAPVQFAWAHAQLLSTEPTESALLDVAPDAVRLNFNEPVSPLAIKAISPDGVSTDLTGATTGGLVVTIPLSSGMANGTHVVSWRVVSADGHPIGGSLIFSIGTITGAATQIPAAGATGSVALWAGKAALFICLFIGAGGALFSGLAPVPQSSRRLSAILSGAGLIVAPATLGLQGLDALALPLTAIGDSNTWSTALSTSYGATAIAAMIAFVLAHGALWLSPGRLALAFGLAAGAVTALSLALSGHAGAASPQWLTRPAVFLHIAGVTFWVGALYPLWCLLRRRSAGADHALGVFSKAIPWAVLALVLSGATLAFVQMGTPGPQWISPYGLILGTKLALLALLFGLALWNRIWLTEPTLAGNDVARRHLRRSIGVEMAIVVAVLGLVAGWRFTPPPRALAVAAVAATAEPQLLHLMEGNVMAMVLLSPGSAGPSTFDIQLSDAAGTPITVQEVSLTLSSPALGIEPIKRSATDLEGAWRVEDLTIPVSGTWSLALDIRVSRFELVGLRSDLDIP